MDPPKGDSNPFSFKTFMKRGEGPPPPAGTAAPKAKKSGSRKKGSVKKDAGETIPVLDEDSTGSKKPESENPFSFVKFVERKSSKSSASTSQHNPGLFSSSSSGEEENSLTVVDQIPLPPPAVTSSAATQKPPSAPKAGKPPKSSTSSSSSITKKKEGSKKIPKQQKKEISIFDDSADDGEDEIFPPSSAVPRTAGVLNGSAIPSHRHHSSSASSSSSSSSSNSPKRRGLGLGTGDGPTLDGMLDVGFGEPPEVRKLRVDNERLQSELTRHQEELTKEKEKNAVLKSKIKVLKKKEAEDAKALEDMVQKVESNLVTTTKRAVSAEAMIKQLKQEVSSLEAQLTKSTPQAVHQHYEDILKGVREKSTYASQQLVAASAMADKNIRELLSGAEMLKSIAEVLQFVDRISEVRTSDSKSTT